MAELARTASEEGPAKITLDKSECPVDTVTVFNDRAEVTRIVEVTAESAGEHILLVEGLSSCVDTDSVRVNGTGHIVLQEVSFDVHHKVVVDRPATTTEEYSTKVDTIRAQIEELNTDMSALQKRKEVAENSRSMLSKFAESAISPAPVPVKEDAAPDTTQMMAEMEAAFSLMEKTAQRRAAYNDEINGYEEALAAKQKLLDLAHQRLQSLGATRHARTHTVTSRDVTVVFNAKKEGAVSLRLVYMVTNASWTPAYDVRVGTGIKNVQLTYHAMIQQSTGEEWANTKLVLSTAKPSVGGSAPILPTKHIRYQPTYQHRARNHSLNRSMPVSAQAESLRLEAQFSECEDDSDDDSIVGTTAVAATTATTSVESSGAATTFHVERRTTVASDNKAHKVTVAIIDLIGSFRHYAVPAISPVAYLQCLTTNTSAYTLLAGQLNIFLDGSFVSKASLQNVAPGEKFRTFLGSDSTVKVEYRPIGKKHEENGYFSKSSTNNFSFVTTIKNTKATKLQIVVADMLPISDDHNIKVKLLEPSAEVVAAGSKAERKRKKRTAAGEKTGFPADMVAQIPATNNLVWSRTIAPGKTCVLPFQYSIEHPAGRAYVSYDVKHASAATLL